jgi:hypothetical protein
LSRRSETIEVGVRQRVLWIGAEAYPLQNIARVQKIKLVPQRWAAFRRFLGSAIVWITLGIFASLLVDPNSRTGVVAVVLALTIISSIRLIRTLLEQELYALVIETAGNPHTALVASDRNQVTSIARAIVDAINNPHAEFRTLVQNIHAGDRIQQYGSYNVGKVSP